MGTASEALERDPEVLRRFLARISPDDCYPPMTGGFFRLEIGEEWPQGKVLSAWARGLEALRSGKAPRALGLYIHWPFCLSRCRFCFCPARVPERAGEMRGFLERLKAEMGLFSRFFRGFSFDSVYFGGGTPSFISEGDLAELLRALRDSFAVGPGAQVLFEAAPSSLTLRKLELLRSFGLNRLTLGIQTLDRDVLRSMDRGGQTLEGAERAVGWVRRFPGVALNVDLMCGLPGQSPASFLKDVARVCRWRPEMIHINQFDPRGQARSALEGGALSEGDRLRARRMLEAANHLVRRLGFRPPRRREKARVLRRLENRQHISVRWNKGSLLSLGPGVFSHVFGQCWYRPAPGKEGAGGGFLAVPFGLEEEMRGYALHHLETHRRLARARFRRLFGSDPLETVLGRHLRDLEAEGLLRINRRWVDFPYSGVHPGRRLAALRRLFSPAMVSRLMAVHGADCQAFAARCREIGPQAADEELVSCSRDSFTSRRYLKLSAAPES